MKFRLKQPLPGFAIGIESNHYETRNGNGFVMFDRWEYSVKFCESHPEWFELVDDTIELRVIKHTRFFGSVYYAIEGKNPGDKRFYPITWYGEDEYCELRRSTYGAAVSTMMNTKKEFEGEGKKVLITTQP